MAVRGSVDGAGFVDAEEVGDEEDEAKYLGEGDVGHAG